MKTFIRILRDLLLCLIVISGPCAVTWLVCKQIYTDEGREQYHREILEELEAKGGAPALLYPPDAMFEYLEDSE